MGPAGGEGGEVDRAGENGSRMVRYTRACFLFAAGSEGKTKTHLADAEERARLACCGLKGSAIRATAPCMPSMRASARAAQALGLLVCLAMVDLAILSSIIRCFELCSLSADSRDPAPRGVVTNELEWVLRVVFDVLR